MKTPLSFLTIFIFSCLLVSCASTHAPSTLFNRQQVVATTKQKYPPKNPQHVALYTDKVPRKAYKIIGIVTVAKYDLLGVDRSDATMDRMMRKLAASIGGDAIINVSSNDQQKKGKIVAYQKILL